MLSTAQVAVLGKTTQATVKREIARGNLAAQKIGRTWVIHPGEAQRWAGQYRPYAAQRTHAA